jgi:hypothetical protein
MPTNDNSQLPLSVREPRPAAPVSTTLSDVFFQAWPLSPASAIPTSNRVGPPSHMADRDAPPTHAAYRRLVVHWKKPRSTRPPHIVPCPPTAENPQLAAGDSPRLSVPNRLTGVAMEGCKLTGRTRLWGDRLFDWGGRSHLYLMATWSCSLGSNPP